MSKNAGHDMQILISPKFAKIYTARLKYNYSSNCSTLHLFTFLLCSQLLDGTVTYVCLCLPPPVPNKMTASSDFGLDSMSTSNTMDVGSIGEGGDSSVGAMDSDDLVASLQVCQINVSVTVGGLKGLVVHIITSPVFR